MPVKRKDKLHYVGVRERWVKAVTYLIAEGIERSGTSFAASIDVDPTQVNRIIQIVREKLDVKESPTINMIVEICTKYGISAEWIMTGKGSMTIPESEKQKLKRLEKQINQITEIINL